MTVKFHRASWLSILTCFAALLLLGLTFVPQVHAQSRITVLVSPATASVQA